MVVALEERRRPLICDKVIVIECELVTGSHCESGIGFFGLSLSTFTSAVVSVSRYYYFDTAIGIK